MRKILMVKGQSKYNVVRCFVDEVAKGLRKNDCEVEVLDYMGNEEEFKARLKVLRENPPNVAISFNGIGYEVIREYLEIPYVGWMVDHPTLNHPRLTAWDNISYAVCIDQSHAEMIKRFYTNIRGVYFLPHAGSFGCVSRPYKEREIDVLFSGSYTSSNECLKQLQENLKPYEQKVAFILIMKMQEQNLTLEQALEIFLVENDIAFSNEEFTSLCMNYIGVDYFIRAFYREELIRTLSNNGICVDIYGEKWEQFECENKENLRLHEPLDFMESLEVMGNAKISLNSIPSFKGGGHERIFSAMLNGSLCVTDSNAYLEEQFVNGEEIFSYQRDDMQKAADGILYYLQHEEEAAKIADHAYKAASQKATWEIRAKELLDIMEEKGIF